MRAVAAIVFLVALVYCSIAVEGSANIIDKAECAAGCEMFRILMRQNREWYSECYYECTHPWKPTKKNAIKQVRNKFATLSDSENVDLTVGATVCLESGSNFRETPCGKVVGISNDFTTGRITASKYFRCDDSIGNYRWIKLDLGGVNKVWVADRGQFKSCPPSPSPIPTGTSVQSALMQWAKETLTGKGIPYRTVAPFGPSTGFGCSPFTFYVLQRAGINIPAYSPSQMNIGTKISRIEDLQVGDLVFWYFPSSEDWLQRPLGQPNHVGFYIGNNMILHSSGGKGPNVAPLSGGYVSQFLQGRRIMSGNEKLNLFL